MFLLLKTLNIYEMRPLEATFVDNLDLKPNCSLTDIIIYVFHMCEVH